VSEEYARHRRDARVQAVARNRLLTAASRAYLSGRRDEAKQLSQRGQEINLLMKNAHKQVSIYINAFVLYNMTENKSDIYSNNNNDNPLTTLFAILYYYVYWCLGCACDI